MANHTFTYQTRIHCNKQGQACLDAIAQYLSHIERCLYADYCKGRDIRKIKSEYLSRYGITARQYNALRVSLEGKIRSCKELQGQRIDHLQGEIKKLEKSIKRFSKYTTSKELRLLHHRKRQLDRKQNQFRKLEQAHAKGQVNICFGTKKLFKKQYHLHENGYQSHEEWKASWQDARNSQFFVLGSKDETAGNQSCIATINENGKLSLKLRVPNALSEQFGKHLCLENVALHYGKDEIESALAENQKRNQLQKKKARDQYGDLYKGYGTAMCYRFARDSKGWRVFITLEKSEVALKSEDAFGAIGVDINANHLAITEINHHGNYINSFNLPTNLYGKSQEQAKAIIGDAVTELVKYALEKNKPLVIEKLEFTEKKKALSTNNKRKARALSSFAYSKIIQNIKSKAFRLGIEVKEINPAYTSVIGRVKFGRIYSSLSVHQTAALAIARRFYGFSEKLPHCWNNIPDNTGGRVTLPKLEKILGRHVWSTWAVVSKKLKEVLAAPFQTYRAREYLCAQTREFDSPEDALPF